MADLDFGFPYVYNEYNMSGPTLDLVALSKRTRFRRLQLNLTTRGVQDRGGPSEGMVRKIEDVKLKRPGHDVLRRLAHALDTELDTLTGVKPLPGYAERSKVVDDLRQAALLFRHKGDDGEFRRFLAMAEAVETQDEYWLDWLRLDNLLTPRDHEEAGK